MNTQEELILALKSERQRFADRGHDTTEHDAAIKYLETGELSEDPNEYELLDAVINDFESVCGDYDITLD